MSVKCGHCHNHHETVRDVRQCAMRTGVPAGAIAEQNGLIGARYTFFDDALPTSAPATASFDRSDANVPAQAVSAARERMFGAEQANTPRRERKRAEEGIYRKAGSIYRVVTAHHGSGLRYAQRLTETATTNAKNGKPKFKWEIAKGFVFELRTEHLLTLDEAKEFGQLYGTCCVCGRILTNPDSIAAGIGPICAEKF